MGPKNRTFMNEPKQIDHHTQMDRCENTQKIVEKKLKINKFTIYVTVQKNFVFQILYAGSLLLCLYKFSSSIG